MWRFHRKLKSIILNLMKFDFNEVDILLGEILWLSLSHLGISTLLSTLIITDIVTNYPHRCHHSTKSFLMISRFKLLKEGKTSEKITFGICQCKLHGVSFRGKRLTWKVFMKENPWPSRGTMLVFECGDWTKPRKTSDYNSLTEIQTWRIQNTSLEHYRYRRHLLYLRNKYLIS